MKKWIRRAMGRKRIVADLTPAQRGLQQEKHLAGIGRKIDAAFLSAWDEIPTMPWIEGIDFDKMSAFSADALVSQAATGAYVLPAEMHEQAMSGESDVIEYTIELPSSIGVVIVPGPVLVSKNRRSHGVLFSTPSQPEPLPPSASADPSPAPVSDSPRSE